MKNYFSLAVFAALFLVLDAHARGQTAGTSGANDLLIAQGATTAATIVVAGDAGPWEKAAAGDLAKYYPDAWESLRTDIYAQGQGVRHTDEQSYTGHYWYQTAVDFPAAQSPANVRLMFPGLFNDCWVYLNGELIAHRVFREPWWRNDYKFEWDVDLAGKLKPGTNLIALRGYNPHHFGGMFRRPFLYRPIGK